MKKPTLSTTSVAALLTISLFATAQAGEDALMQAMRDEMARTVEQLRMEDLEAPYFVSYTVRDTVQMSAQASFGALLASGENRGRSLQVELRVGDPSFDNTNFNFGPGVASATLPLEDDAVEIRRQIWIATDAAYKRALEGIAAKRAALKNQTRSEDLADFSAAEPFTYSEEPSQDLPALLAIESLARRLSELFTRMPEIKESSAHASARRQRTYYLNSEGAYFIRNDPSASVRAIAQTQALDGTALHDFVAAYGNTWEEVADENGLTGQVTSMGQALAARRSAPAIDDYIGPVLFEGQAAAELLAQVLAPRLAGIRLPDTAGGFAGLFGSTRNPFLDKIGARVLARSLSLVDDPTRLGGGFIGGRAVDDDGVPTRVTSLVENGILRTLLTTRNPVRGIDGSTGSRRGPGPAPSNLLLTTRQGMSREELLAELMLLVEESQAEYGIIVRRLGNASVRPPAGPMDIAFLMMRGSQQSRVENAKLAYKVYPDGREELIQKAEFTAITDSLFKEVVAASESSTVYTFGSSGFGLGIGISFGGPVVSMQIGGPGGSGNFVSVSVPDLLFEEVTLRKPAGNVPHPPVADHPFFGE